MSYIFLRRSTSRRELLHRILASRQVHKRLRTHFGVTDLHQAFPAQFADLLEVCMRQVDRADLHTSVHNHYSVANIVRVPREDPYAAHDELCNGCSEGEGNTDDSAPQGA
jgi:hypothetical protein